MPWKLILLLVYNKLPWPQQLYFVLQRWSGRTLRPGFGHRPSYHGASALVWWPPLCWPGSVPPGPNYTSLCLCLSLPVCHFSCMCAHRLSLFYLSPLKLIATVVVCLLSSIPESPRWLLLKKRMDVLEHYRNNSPKDKHFLDLVTMRSLDSSFSTCCFWVTDSSYLDESRIILIIYSPARNSKKYSKKRDFNLSYPAFKMLVTRLRPPCKEHKPKVSLCV